MSSALNALTSVMPSSPTTTTGQTASPSDPLANESTFLTLLVSQLKNQDPLSPVDSTQFVSQLTSYSQLEQLIGINKNTSVLNQTSTPTATNGTTGTSSAAI